VVVKVGGAVTLSQGHITFTQGLVEAGELQVGSEVTCVKVT